jgi:hypothetical protein
MMVPISSHPLALDWEEQRPLITFQEDIHLCGCNGKSAEIGNQMVSAPQLWKRFLFV